jgi:hypothetical protein
MLRCISNYLKEVLPMTTLKDEMQAVHDDDLIDFLKSLGVYEDILAGKEKCFFCSTVISLDNIQCVFPYDNEIKFCCINDDCCSKFAAIGVL